MTTASKCAGECFRSIFDGNEFFLDYDHTADKFSLEISSPVRIPLLGTAFTSKDKEAIVALSSRFLSTPFELYDVLKDALNGNMNWKGTLALDVTKKTLTYKCKPFTKTIDMVIGLSETSPTNRKKLDALIPSLGCTPITTISPRFNPLRSEFKYSDDGKIITKTTPAGWVGNIAKEKLYPTGVQSFSVKVLALTDWQIMVGITVGTTDLAGGTYNKSTTWVFHGNNGHVYSGGARGYYDNLVKVAPGDVITTVVDMDKRTVSFEFNGVLIAPCIRFTVTNEQLNDIRPVVDLHHPNDSAAFE